MTDITLNSFGWSGSQAPYSYIINNARIKNNSVLDLIINCNTKELIDTVSKYQISGYKQELGRVTIYAWGEKPSINIEASLVVRGGY